MSYVLTRCNVADIVGYYRQADEAKAAVPGVQQWRRDPDWTGWSGWLPDSGPGSPPDFQIIYTGAGEGFTWDDREMSRARQARAAARSSAA
jgi:hypothetical protein